MEENKKPFILEMEEAKLEIIQAVNNAIQVHKLPCYLIDMILSEIGVQIKDGAKNELAMARAQLNNGEEVA